MLKKFRIITITEKLFTLIGLMSVLILIQYCALFYTSTILVSVRSLIYSEGVWSKSQKNAVINIYQYAKLRDVYFLNAFNEQIDIINNYKIARIELNKSNKDIDINLVRKGLMQGQLLQSEADGVIHILKNYRNISYVQNAIERWAYGDELVVELQLIAKEIQQNILSNEKTEKILNRINHINNLLTKSEQEFSKYFIDGSRQLVRELITIVGIIILVLNGVAIYLVFRFGTYFSNTLKRMKQVALQVGEGNLNIQIPIDCTDELGELSNSLNLTIQKLRLSTEKQKKYENSIKESNERFSIIVDAVKEYAIFSIDLEGRVQSWNSGAEYTLGYAEDEIMNKHYSVLYAPENESTDFLDLNFIEVKNCKRTEKEILCRKKDGTLFWAHVTLNSNCSEESRPSGFTQIIRDITEKKMYEIELRNYNRELENKVQFRTREIQWRETQLNQITNALPVSVCQVNKNMKFLFVNESFCQLIGKNRVDIIDLRLQNVLNKNLLNQLQPSIQKVLAGQAVNTEIYFDENALSIAHHFSLVPDFNGGSEVIGFVLVAHSIKKFKEIEAELINAKKLAEIANETKSAFLANMSHEIRTPLGAVLGLSEIILNNEITDSQKESIGRAIKRNGKLLSNVINDILDLSKVEAGKLEIEKVKLPFDEIIKDIESLLSLKATEKGIRLDVHTDGSMPLAIKTDPLRLRQILLNIIGNAIKFTRFGTVDVKIHLVIDPTHKNSKLAFVIQDTGSGMTTAQAEKLFTPFNQADASTTRKYGGTGLGLALSKKLALALGGDVVLTKTEPGIGSIFTITIDTGLPVSASFKKYDGTQLEIDIEPRDEIFDFRGMKILLAEDSTDNQFIITHFLKSTGAELKIVNNGQECIDAALIDQFDLILLDLQMPVMGGFEAIKKLNEMHCNIPILALTAHAMKEDRKQCINAGFKDHLSKPVNRQALLKAIRFWTVNKLANHQALNMV